MQSTADRHTGIQTTIILESSSRAPSNCMQRGGKNPVPLTNSHAWPTCAVDLVSLWKKSESERERARKAFKSAAYESIITESSSVCVCVYLCVKGMVPVLLQLWLYSAVSGNLEPREREREKCGGGVERERVVLLFLCVFVEKEWWVGAAAQPSLDLYTPTTTLTSSLSPLLQLHEGKIWLIETYINFSFNPIRLIMVVEDLDWVSFWLVD